MRNPEEIKKQILGLVEEYHSAAFPQKPFEPGITKIDNSGPLRDAQDFKAGVGAVLDGCWTQGKYAKEFERKLADYIGLNHGLFVNSGSFFNCSNPIAH